MSSTDDTSTVVEEPEAAPADEAREALVATLREHLGDAVLGTEIAADRATWVRVERFAWLEAATVVKERLAMRFFDFLSAIDWLPSPYGRYEDSVIDTGVPTAKPDAETRSGTTGGETRFQVFTHLIDVDGHRDVFLKADVNDDDPRIASLTPLFGGANWHERECFEMFGIVFEGHPDLRHIYLPTGFEGHPLRKDFPLLARLVKPWPGIVDVEPMPGGAADDEDATSEEEAT